MSAYGSSSSATYRADGLRASKTTSSGTTYFLYDGSEPVVEMNSSGTVTALNVFAPDGLVARQTSSSTSEYVFDQQGNVADTTNTSGVIQTITQYDAWGNEQAISGTPSDPFGYNAQSGYYLDRETGLYLCQHRFYDPANGRWLNRDPIGYGGGTNLYGYTADGPVGTADASGFDGPIDLALDAVEIMDAEADAAGLGDSVSARLAGFVYRAGRWVLPAAAVIGNDPNAAEQAAGAVSAGCDAIGNLIYGGASGTDTGPFPNNLPRDGSGATLPDPAAGDSPHTRLRSRVSSSGRNTYTQGHQFGPGGEFEGRVDTWDARGKPVPHWHPWGGADGGWRLFPWVFPIPWL
jgi:RHS repeat-associated protein